MSPGVYCWTLRHSCCRKFRVSWLTSTGRSSSQLLTYSSSRNDPDMPDKRQIKIADGQDRPEDPLVLQEVCDDPSSVISGVVVVQSGAWSHGLQSVWDDAALDLVRLASAG